MFVGGEFVKLFEPGDYFGEMALLTGEPRNATIRSQGNCACLALKGEDWEAILGKYNELLLRGMQRRLLQEIPFIKKLTKNLSNDEERLLHDSFHPVHFAKGDLVMREGDPADAVYVLEEGEVRSHRLLTAPRPPRPPPPPILGPPG